jgi:hypothetical protein
MFNVKSYAKIYPEESYNEAEQLFITNYICKEYSKTKSFSLIKIIDFIKQSIFRKSVQSFDIYYDPEFIVLETLPKEKIFKLIQIFMKNKNDSLLYLDIAKYIRKHWHDKSIKDFIDEITDNLSNYNINNSKYWLYQFYPLIESGEQLILELIKNKKLEGEQTELLYGIYLMEPERLNNFYPLFLLTVEKSNCFYLWSNSGAYYENFKIIEKLYFNGYNIFTNQLLENFWVNQINNVYYKKIKNQIALIYR